MSSDFFRMILPSFGGIDVFSKQKIPDLQPIANQLKIRVSHIGINYADVLTRQGWYKWAGKPPICPGFEVSGVVEQVGNEQSDFQVGDRVLGLTKFNGYSESLLLEEKRVRKLPVSMSFADAAALPAVYITAYHSLFEIMRIRKGEDILIQAVAGGVGIAALQLAKYAGLTTYGTASSEQKLEFARQKGLDFAINYREDDFEVALKKLTSDQGVKFVLDSIGGTTLRKGYDCLKPGGMAVTIGGAGLVPSGDGFFDLMGWIDSAMDLISGGVYHPFSMIEDNKGLAGVQILLLWEQLDHMAKIMDEILTLYQEGVCIPHIDQIFPLEQAGLAHEYIESRKSKGKILLKTDMDN